MSNSSCPFLISEDTEGRQRAPQPYPSFENSCSLAEANDSLLLADQATFCLSGSCHFCTRYQHALTQGIEPSSIGLQGSMPTAVGRDPFRPNERTAPFTGPRSSAQTSSSSPMAEQQRRSTGDVTADVTAGVAPEISTTVEEVLDDMLLAEDEPTLASSFVTRWYSWAAAALLFFAVLSVGAVIAAYMGWQIALDRLAVARSAQVNTLASAPVEQQIEPQFAVVTIAAMPQTVSATNTPSAVESSGIEMGDNRALVTAPPATAPDSFPQAVTATPIVIVPLPPTSTSNGGQPQSDPLPTNTPAVIPPTATLASLQLPAVESTPTPVPVINVQVEVPTRRPTPAFDIPTSTPEPLQPTPTETPLPILGTPVIVFAPDEASVPPGECTHVRWHVENVRAVYYESLPAFGDGSKEECLKDESDSYALTITFADGQTKIYTTTVTILWPTPTPSATPSFTPEILPTETWTPLPPTATPTPDVVFGAKLEINGDNPYRCNAGSQCNIGVLATNTGDSLDTLAIEILASGSWPATVCSQIGTCSTQRLVIANVGPQNTVFTTLQVTVPADSIGQQTSYALRVASDGSGGTVTSQVIELTLESTE